MESTIIGLPGATSVSNCSGDKGRLCRVGSTSSSIDMVDRGLDMSSPKSMITSLRGLLEVSEAASGPKLITTSLCGESKLIRMGLRGLEACSPKSITTSLSTVGLRGLPWGESHSLPDRKLIIIGLRGLSGFTKDFVDWSAGGDRGLREAGELKSIMRLEGVTGSRGVTSRLRSW